MPALGRGTAPSGLPCGLQRSAESSVHGDELLLEPQAPTGELTDQRRGTVEVQIVRPLARQRSFLDVLAPEFWNRPLEVGADPPEVSKDANTRGIEIPEMDDRHVAQESKEQPHRCRVPARNVDDEPVGGRLQVLVRSEVLDEQRGANGALEDSSVEERPLRDSDLSKDACDLRRLDRRVTANEAEARMAAGGGRFRRGSPWCPLEQPGESGANSTSSAVRPRRSP